MSANSAFVDEEDEFDDAEDQETDSLDDGDDASTDNVGDASVEINVEELLDELESDGLISPASGECQAKRRLEELMEQRRARRDLEDFDDYEL